MVPTQRAGGMPGVAVPCSLVPQTAVPVPRKMPVPEVWKLAECLIALLREEEAVAVSRTVMYGVRSPVTFAGCADGRLVSDFKA
jgi:trimethylamine:corrinoid methyltransferase-like protein